jgi:diguanylate cyclase (GGDEF)-like protein/PAS domain S-box-containing protein
VHAQLESLFAQSPDAISLVDADGRYIRINPAAERMLGFTSAEIAGKSVGSVAMELTPLQKLDMGAVVAKALRSPKPTRLEVETFAKDGARYVLALIAVPVVAAGTAASLFVIAIDVTAEKVAREELALMNLRLKGLASFDTLTGLANRSLLAARFDRAIADAERTNEQIAVYYIDVDKFKNVNDTYGHHVGDEVLRTVASRLERSCRRTDTVARIGGDEFVVLRAGPSIGTIAADLADRMRVALEAPCDIEGLSLTFSVGIGICTFPEDGRNQQTLLANADAALYASKTAGKGSIRRYQNEPPLSITG